MPKIERKTQKIFGGNADSDQLAVFGTMITGTPVYNDDIETLQSEAYTEGWQAAVAANEAPFMEEMNGVQYGFSKQLAYLFQQGIAEWDAGTTYYLNSFCQVGGVIYKSMQDENINHSPADDTEGTYWSPLETGGGGSSGLEVGDIGMALYVDETKGLRRYLNGQIVDLNANTQAFLNRLKQITTLHPSLLCTEEEWQTAKTMSAFGQVGKFVFNYSGNDIVSVRLPRVVNVQGLFDLQNLGVTVAAGLPNITGFTSDVYHTANVTATGAFYKTGTNMSGSQTGTSDNAALGFNASRSNSIYGNSDTVQPEQIQYPYFIQIATGAETENNIINDIELNNPFSLFDSKYSDHELNNLSWLKSEGQWNAKAVYPTAYDKLLKVYNGTETVEGLSVKLSTEEYTDYDFVLNTADETFRLPLLDGSEDLPSDNLIHVSGNLTISSPEPVSVYTAPKNCYVTLRTYGMTLVNSAVVGYIDGRVAYTQAFGSLTNQNSDILFMQRNQTLTLHIISVNSTTPTVSYNLNVRAAQGNGSLYYYTGETVQNASLIDAGRLGEQLATKTDMLQASGAGMPSNKYIDLTLGASGSSYTAPANGWIFVGGMSTANSGYFNLVNTSAGSLTFSLQKPAASQGGGGYIPVNKGDTFTLSYNVFNIDMFRFIYAQGAQGGS